MCNYLGIFVDIKLTFKFHIEHVCKKLTKFCGIVWKARYIFSKQHMFRFYKAYVIPTITYGVLIYGKTFQPHLTEIMKSQKRVWRAICFKRRYESIKESMDENKCLLFLIYFFRSLNTCLRNCDRTKKIVLSEIYSEKMDHVPGAKRKA